MNRRIFAKILLCLIVFILGIFATILYQKKHALISLFPIQNYDQEISDWIKPTDPDYNKPLLTNAQQKLKSAEWFDHYFGKKSPWNSDYINRFFSEVSPQDFNLSPSEDEAGFGSNFRPISPEWFAKIKNNINKNAFIPQQYSASKRAIAINNIHGRTLPTDEPLFYNAKIAGEGYPFDHLEMSVIWAGTPLYILGTTRDYAWTLVLEPSFMAWVPSNAIADVNEKFVNEWTKAAEKNLVAMTDTDISIQDSENNIYRFSGYVGMFFPGDEAQKSIQILIPVVNEQHQAVIHHARLSEENAALMPILPTPKHIIDLMAHLIHRPYGWGGMYFYNDCAMELKSLFTPFEIWLASGSENQVTQETLKKTDLSDKTVDERIQYLMQHGHKFMTIVYVGGHVFLYLGNYENPRNSQQIVALSYQNVWGLKPDKNFWSMDRRSVIGESVLLPILKRYPEDWELGSIADRKYFELLDLDV